MSEKRNYFEGEKILVKFTSKLVIRMRAIAAKRETSVAAIVRQAVYEYLEREEKKGDLETRIENLQKSIRELEIRVLREVRGYPPMATTTLSTVEPHQEQDLNDSHEDHP